MIRSRLMGIVCIMRWRINWPVLAEYLRTRYATFHLFLLHGFRLFCLAPVQDCLHPGL